MNNLQQFALGLLSRNPNVQRNPQAQAMIQAIQNNDAQLDENIAKNLCQSYGVDPQTAYQDACRFFGYGRR